MLITSIKVKTFSEKSRLLHLLPVHETKYQKVEKCFENIQANQVYKYCLYPTKSRSSDIEYIGNATIIRVTTNFTKIVIFGLSDVTVETPVIIRIAQTHINFFISIMSPYEIRRNN